MSKTKIIENSELRSSEMKKKMNQFLKIFCCYSTLILCASTQYSESGNVKNEDTENDNSEIANIQEETDIDYTGSKKPNKDTSTRKSEISSDEAPIKKSIGKMPNDDLALSALKTADDHRNHRLHFTFEQSLNEAIRLYDLIVADGTVSPDLRARAKINTAKIYVTLIKNNTNPEVISRSKNQVLTLVNEVLNDPIYSEDMRAWARRFQSKLYQKSFYDLPKEGALKTAKELLETNLKVKDLNSETVGRTKMQLAMGYLKGFFKPKDTSHKNHSDDTKKDPIETEDLATSDVTKDNPIRLAYNIYLDVAKDSLMPSDLRAKAIMALFNYVQFYTNDNLTPKEIMQRRFQIINSALSFENLSPLITAQIKWLIGTNYLMNAFDVKPSQARAKAKILFNEATHQPQLAEKHRFTHKANLVKLYLQNSFEKTPSESRSIALSIVNELLQNLNVPKDQVNDFKINIVEHFVNNDFKQKKKEAHKRGIEILESIINDDKQNPSFIAQAKWILGRYYIQGLLKPSKSTDDVLKDGIELFKQVLQDGKISLEERNNYRNNLVNMLQNNIFGEEQTKNIFNLMPEMRSLSQ